VVWSTYSLRFGIGAVSSVLSLWRRPIQPAFAFL
jgi:hypothetical protein